MGFWLWWVAASAAEGPPSTTELAVVAPPRWAVAPFTLAELDLRGLGPAEIIDGHRRVLLDRLRQRGWPVRGAETRGPDRTVEARFVLYGELRRKPAPRMVWQLVDRRDEVVQFEAIVPLAPIEDAAGLEPVAAALDGLVDHAGFTRALMTARHIERASTGPFTVRRCKTPGTHGRGRVGRGARAGAAVVISPDGLVWAAAHAVPVPPTPIEVKTAGGTSQARWIAASADLDVALLALPTGTDTPCVALADHLPRAREPALGWHPRQGRTKTRISGFRLHETPETLVVEAPLAPGAFVFDGIGALLGVRLPTGDESRIRPHTALSTGLGIQFGSQTELPRSRNDVVELPDPLYLPPIDRPDDDPLR